MGSVFGKKENETVEKSYFLNHADFVGFINSGGESVILKSIVKRIRLLDNYGETDDLYYVKFVVPDYSKLFERYVFPVGFDEAGIVNIICNYLPYQSEPEIKRRI